MKKGYSYHEAKKVITEKLFKLHRNSNLRITTGTKLDSFYFIMPDDRDYNMFSMSLQDFMQTKNKSQARKIIEGARII